MTPPTDPSFRPRLRRELAAETHGDRIHLYDRVRVGTPLTLTLFAFEIAKLFDGSHSVAEIRADIARELPGLNLPDHVVPGLVHGLDEALLLDSPHFREEIRKRNAEPNRRPCCVGVYDADPEKCRAQLDSLFTAAGGPGAPRALPTSNDLRAVLVPHMDFGRGNVTYGWGFKALAEQTAARTFVIVATSHYSAHRFTLTRQNFETSLGVVETDRAYIDRIVGEYGNGLFDDPLAHVGEHSIEIEVVLLQHLFADRGPIKIVPLLVGSFHDAVAGRHLPDGSADIARMVAALQKAEATNPEPVCYVVSGDLAHIGPKFGDKRKAAGPWLGESEQRDRAILTWLDAADPSGYFNEVAKEGDARRICGLSPTWLALAAARPRTGHVLHYQQFVHPEGFESVSFAAAAFHA
jgi:AmmeMemoRadiSam system protein B